MKYNQRIIFEKATNFIKRNSVWLMLAAIAFWAINQSIPIANTLLLLVLIESIAIGLSGLAAYVYTKTDFAKMQMWNTLGSIFLGVHVCIGLVVMGVYFTQI